MTITQRVVCFVISLLVVPPASAAIEFSFDNAGLALPSMSCPPPPALPVGCDITAIGVATNTSTGSPGPWDFFSLFQIGAPLSMTTFATAGAFSFDDTSAANDDFFGTFTGVLDVTTFMSTISYTITGGSGLFSSAKGLGTGLVSIVFPTDGPPTYSEKGRFVIPEPGTIALLGMALLGLIGVGKRGVTRPE